MKPVIQYEVSAMIGDDPKPFRCNTFDYQNVERMVKVLTNLGFHHIEVTETPYDHDHR